ncbi:hypothetical protein LSH36_247g03142 [Paralvinella palmiformis]|uniref:Uncharacterized protein n=1 Tax=Paralvinella palmiformis TaxID=53620 RepID=A0AAD9JM10_9ANNE|nr:hypothetical protein LSH36_247g03142 [Paralvinella palmiformis]
MSSKKNLATKDKRLEFASVVVNVWDGHFKETELLESLKPVDLLLKAAGDINLYKKREKETRGSKINHFILDGLTRKERRKGTSGPVYDQEKAYFSETIEKVFYTLMEDSLMNAGYGPL